MIPQELGLFQNRITLGLVVFLIYAQLEVLGPSPDLEECLFRTYTCGIGTESTNPHYQH
ncbi:histone deacetylase HDT2-like [Iris pallida]|uniref:Histone deacetylase HDT2-like n=1 Tax=Iris pallida TaxID=29817 RepID=A0AAX6DVS0_IRIPA|nr:histone deacetylase HDT2-like [Iris pallida]